MPAYPRWHNAIRANRIVSTRINLTFLVSRYSSTVYKNRGRNTMQTHLARLPSVNMASRLFGIKNQRIPRKPPRKGLCFLQPIQNQESAPRKKIKPMNTRYPFRITPPARNSQKAIK